MRQKKKYIVKNIILFIYSVIIPMKSCDFYSIIIFATSVTDKSWLNLNICASCAKECCYELDVLYQS